MLELPEVETLRRELDREVSGRKIKSVEVPGAKLVAGHTKKQFADELVGEKVTGIKRRGLLLLASLSSGRLWIIDAHTGGQLRRQPSREAQPAGTKAVITFTQGGELRLIDTGDGMVTWVTDEEGLAEARPELATLGLDPLGEPISWTRFGQLMVERSDKLRNVLADPAAVVGLGPLYGDEILHAAGLRHDRVSHKLTNQEMRRLYRGLVETLHEASKHRGTTQADGHYRDLSGEPGGHQQNLQVYERGGQSCYRCRGTVSKMRVGTRTLYFCADCQI